MRSLAELLGPNPGFAGPRPAIAYEWDSFDAFCNEAERILAIESIDGDEERDGVSLDSAFDAWKAHFTAAEYASGRRVE